MYKMLTLIASLVISTVCVAGNVDIEYYIHNHRDDEVTIKIKDLSSVTLHPNQQYTEVGKTKLSANVFKSMRYESNNKIETTYGESICETALDIGTYWNAGPRVSEVNVNYLKGSKDDCNIDYGEAYTVDEVSHTGKTAYRVYIDIH